MGGSGCNKLQVLEMSEENEFAWTVKADLPAERYTAASAVVDGKLWVMGGIENEEEEWTDSVLVYDIASNTWEAGTPLPRPMASCPAAVHDGELHLIDVGIGSETYALRNGAWEQIADERAPEATSCQSVLLG